jgi:hypothetical protein
MGVGWMAHPHFLLTPSRTLTLLEIVMPQLTQDQIKEICSERIINGVPVRFQIGGQTLNIETGELQPKWVNVMYQLVYWNFTRETAKKIAGWLGVKAIFSSE